jgi:hypothetical protein
MSQTRQFIDQIASGESAAAKQSLEDMLSAKAFESLDAYKKEMASSIFGGVSEAKESEKDEEDEDKEDEDEDKKEDKEEK